MSASNDVQFDNWIPETKLAPDSTANRVLARPDLIETLNHAIWSHRLTVLATPPGYGKSTALSMWLSHQGASAESKQVAWLSLDASENELSHFLMALIESLQTLHPDCGHRAKAFLKGNGYPAPINQSALMNILSGLIIIDIMQYAPQPCAIVFDNLERISNDSVHAAIEYLARRLPAEAHVVCTTTRQIPSWMARLQAYGLLAEFGVNRLAFSPEETKCFLQDALETEVSSELVCPIYRYTEGWPAGVRMIASDLKPNGVEETLRELSNGAHQSNDPISLIQRLDMYFDHSLFSNLSLQLRHFLIQTSVLKQLSLERCEAVADTGNARELFDALRREKLFIVAEHDYHSSDGGTEAVYRYHTAFAAFLQRSLRREMPDTVAELHKRAAQVETEPLHRIEHYMQAGSWEDAISVIASLSDSEQLSTHERSTLSCWLSQLPDEYRYETADISALLEQQSMPQVAHDIGLTARQYQVLKRLADGSSNKDIAEDLIVTLPTIKGHVSQIMRKLNAESRTQAAQRAVDLGLLERVQQ